MKSYHNLDQPLPTIQEVPEAEERELEARERRLRDREADIEARERRLEELEALERRYQALEVAGQAAARRAAPEVSWPHEEAAKKTREAIRSIQAAEKAGGGEALGKARHLLEESPCAKKAAGALMDLAQVAKICGKQALGAVKAAKVAVRDVVVLRCCCQVGTADRGAFLEFVEQAFGGPLDRELRAQLLLAFSKVSKDKLDTFQSNSQQATNRRGYPRPKRQPRSSENRSTEPWYVFLDTIPLTPSADGDGTMRQLEHLQQLEDASAEAFFRFLRSSHDEELNGSACALPPGVLE